MEECPVCLEPLSGTVVQMGCCKNQVHIQCYLPKCPLCRSPLPLPRSAEPNQIIVPIGIPVTPQPTRIQKFAPILSALLIVGFVTAILNVQKN